MIRPARDVDVAIVGGGIVGASCAYVVAERGADVLLLESGRIGREASGMNAGGLRRQGRALPELPLALGLWSDLDKRLEGDLARLDGRPALDLSAFLRDRFPRVA